MIEKVTVYFIEARTGCTCCSYENFTAGPFSSREKAEQRASHYRETARLASQYAPSGVYDLCEVEGEKLPDGRIIACGRVFSSEGEEGEYFYIGRGT